MKQHTSKFFLYFLFGLSACKPLTDNQEVVNKNEDIKRRINISLYQSEIQNDNISFIDSLVISNLVLKKFKVKHKKDISEGVIIHNKNLDNYYILPVYKRPFNSVYLNNKVIYNSSLYTRSFDLFRVRTKLLEVKFESLINDAVHSNEISINRSAFDSLFKFSLSGSKYIEEYSNIDSINSILDSKIQFLTSRKNEINENIILAVKDFKKFIASSYTNENLFIYKCGATDFYVVTLNEPYKNINVYNELDSLKINPPIFIMIYNLNTEF